MCGISIIYELHNQVYTYATVIHLFFPAAVKGGIILEITFFIVKIFFEENEGHFQVTERTVAFDVGSRKALINLVTGLCDFNIVCQMRFSLEKSGL